MSTGILWTDAKQIGLIHSCFNNYSIPPLIFSMFDTSPVSVFFIFFTGVRRDFDGGEIRVCLDGKQRLTSIHRFMLGEIPSTSCVFSTKLVSFCVRQVKMGTNFLLSGISCSTDFVFTASPTSMAISMICLAPNKKQIAVSARNIFMNKQLACVEYEDLTADQEREIIQVCFTPSDLFNSLIKYPKVTIFAT